VHVASYPTADWTAQQIVECCGWDYEPPRFLVHDRDNCYGTSFDRRVRRLGIAQARTPFSSPRANAIAECWVRSVRTECLDHVFIFNERHLQKVLAEFVRLDNVRPAHRRHLRRSEAFKLERSLQYRCLEVSIMFISGPLDVLHQILAPFTRAKPKVFRARLSLWCPCRSPAAACSSAPRLCCRTRRSVPIA
jgi:hypothetical protein